jgi:arylsulfatase A-like enzyme
VHPSRAVRHAAAAIVALAALVGLVVACTVDGGRHHAAARPGSPSLPPPPPGGPAAHPNIVFVLTDDLSSDLVQYMPHVRALARRGTSFSNYFVVDSLCCPSRASILTGQYPHNTRVFYNAGPQGGYTQFQRIGDGRNVYGLALQSVGYRTGIMGKYLNHYPPKARPPAGWNEWDVTGSQGYAEFGYDLNVNGSVHHFGHRPRDYLTDVLSGAAQRFIAGARASGRPFALEVATYAPHSPSTPAPADRYSFRGLAAPRGPEWDRLPTAPPSWLAHYPRLSALDVARIDALYRRRVEAVQAVDRLVGRLETELRRQGLLDDTYFVFSSDNGFHMGQRRMLPGKQTAYDTDVRVPLVVAGPGVPAGRLDPTLVSSIDLTPTFEQIAGAPPRTVMDGQSLLPLWHGQPAPARWPAGVLIEHRSSNRGGDPDRQSLRSGLSPSYEAVRTREFLYVEYVDGNREYYDLRRDPDELHNVVAQLSPGRLIALHQYLASLSTCRGAVCRTQVLAAG